MIDTATPYKRDQVERALAAVTGRITKVDRTPDAGLKADVKRLLDFDRKQGVDNPAFDARERRHAFFDELPPGRGVDLAYTIHHAFSLLLGLRLLQGGLPQGAVVRLLRHSRSDLFRELDRILAINPHHIRPDQVAPALERLAEHGMLANAISGMVFFLTPGGLGASYHRRDPETGDLQLANLCRTTPELLQALESFGRSGAPVIAIELVNPAHQLRHWLERIPERPRGRPRRT
ncbi:hypothetical protein [Azospirillum doebereinerae]